MSIPGGSAVFADHKPGEMDKEGRRKKDQQQTMIDERYQEMMQFIETELTLNSKINKDRLTELKTRISSWAVAQAKLEGKIEKLEEENARLRKEKEEIVINKCMAIEKPTYADMASKKMVSTKSHQIETTKKSNPTVFLFPKDQQDTKQVYSKFKQSIDPKKEKIRIKSVRQTPKMVIVETESEEDLKKIENCETLKETIKCEKPRKRNPLIVMYHVPSNLKDEEIVDSVYIQNFDTNMSKDEFISQFVPKFKTGPKGKETVHQVVEVSPVLRKLLLNRVRVYLGYTSVAVKDFLTIPRCLKCQDLGHVSKYCPQEKIVCGHCGEQDHKKKDCGKQSQPAVCIPCSNRKKKCAAKESKDCQTYQMLRTRLIQKTDYGQ